jgi:hypothetical protein
VVDEDVKSLGLSNREIRLLDRCIAMLKEKDRPELALRVLKRYTTEGFSDAADWQGWLEANRSRLFFTDVGGYKFLVAPVGLSRSPASVTAGGPLDVQRPLKARAELVPAKVRPGEALEIVLTVELAPTWHIYAVSGSKGPGAATTLELTLPEAVVAEGDWTVPEPGKGADGQLVYEGTLQFRHRLRVSSRAPAGSIEAAIKLGYQACDPFHCRLPEAESLPARGEITREGR